MYEVAVPTGRGAAGQVVGYLGLMVASLGILVLTSCGNDGPDERGEGAVDQAEIMLGERVYPVMFALAIFVVLAWKVAGRIGVNRWLLPALGIPGRLD